MHPFRLFALIGLVTAQTASAASPLEAKIQSALSYLQAHQTSGNEAAYERGQWPTKVTSTIPSVIGVGRYNVPYDEPTAFGAASISGILAEIYQVDSSYTSIPAMIKKTKAGFSNYRTDSVFHFYPAKDFQGHQVRGPRFMHLKPRWYGFTNTPPDADTTSVAYLLLAYDRAIDLGTSPLRSGFDIPHETAEEYTAARDLGRNPHIYNAMHGNGNTGAFLTWLYDEKNPEMPRYYFASPDQGTRIPFNKNDVDCVVNANVLKMLTATNRTNTPGYADSCNYLNDVAARDAYYRCGMYYPSRYALPYAMASAIKLGVSCLKPSQNLVVDQILARQREDGSWKNHWKARPDYVQSTAWALNTLLLLGDAQNPAHRLAAQRGLNFLVAQSTRDSKGRVYWQGEVFYAAIFIARFPVVWRSDAYTTATAVKAMTLAKKKWNLR
ncbi:MAG: hypothetical protein ACK5P7_04785 [Bdellovibrio sp.]|jgi:hypothetical protein